MGSDQFSEGILKFIPFLEFFIKERKDLNSSENVGRILDMLKSQDKRLNKSTLDKIESISYKLYENCKKKPLVALKMEKSNFERVFEQKVNPEVYEIDDSDSDDDIKFFACPNSSEKSKSENCFNNSDIRKSVNSPIITREEDLFSRRSASLKVDTPVKVNKKDETKKLLPKINVGTSQIESIVLSDSDDGTDALNKNNKKLDKEQLMTTNGNENNKNEHKTYQNDFNKENELAELERKKKSLEDNIGLSFDSNGYTIKINNSVPINQLTNPQNQIIQSNTVHPNSLNSTFLNLPQQNGVLLPDQSNFVNPMLPMVFLPTTSIRSNQISPIMPQDTSAMFQQIPLPQSSLTNNSRDPRLKNKLPSRLQALSQNPTRSETIALTYVEHCKRKKEAERREEEVKKIEEKAKQKAEEEVLQNLRKEQLKGGNCENKEEKGIADDNKESESEKEESQLKNTVKRTIAEGIKRKKRKKIESESETSESSEEIYEAKHKRLENYRKKRSRMLSSSDESNVEASINAKKIKFNPEVLKSLKVIEKELGKELKTVRSEIVRKMTEPTPKPKPKPKPKSKPKKKEAEKLQEDIKSCFDYNAIRAATGSKKRLCAQKTITTNRQLSKARSTASDDDKNESEIEIKIESRKKVTLRRKTEDFKRLDIPLTESDEESETEHFESEKESDENYETDSFETHRQEVKRVLPITISMKTPTNISVLKSKAKKRLIVRVKRLKENEIEAIKCRIKASGSTSPLLSETSSSRQPTQNFLPILMPLKSVPILPKDQRLRKKGKSTKIQNIDKSNHFYNSEVENKCLLCNKKAKNIVHHYVNKHKKEEVFISRLPSVIIEHRLKSPIIGNMVKNSSSQYNVKCIFCQIRVFENINGLFEHYASHTGEFAYKCKGCGLRTPYEKDLKIHVKYKKCGSRASKDQLYAYNKEMKIMINYCTKCNYCQLNKANVFQHLKNEHGDRGDFNKFINTLTVCILKDEKDAKNNLDNSNKEQIVSIPQNNNEDFEDFKNDTRSIDDKIKEAMTILNTDIHLKSLIEELTEEVAAENVPEEVAAENVPEEVAAENVPEEVAAENVPEEVAVENIPEEDILVEEVGVEDMDTKGEELTELTNENVTDGEMRPEIVELAELVEGTQTVDNSANLEKNNPLKPWSENTNFLKSKKQYDAIKEKCKMPHLYKCVHCGSSTDDASDAENHCITHNKEGFKFPADKPWFECPYCEVILKTPSSFVEHIRSEHGGSSFQCANCFYRACTLYHVKFHQTIFHSNSQSEEKNILIGSDMNILFGSSMDYICKNIIESRNQYVEPIKCHLCVGTQTKVFLKEGLAKHFNNVHINASFCDCNNRKLLACIYCKYETNYKDKAKLHIINVHPSKHPYCLARFRNKKMNDELTLNIKSTVLVYIGPTDYGKYIDYIKNAKRKEAKKILERLNTEKKSLKNLLMAENDQVWSSSKLTNSIKKLNSEIDDDTYCTLSGYQTMYKEMANIILNQTGVCSEELYPCFVIECKIKFSKIDELKQHLKQCHNFDPTEKIMLKCPHCREPVLVENLKNHAIRHIQHRCFCFYCGFSAASNEIIVQHLITHHGIHQSRIVSVLPLTPYKYTVAVKSGFFHEPILLTKHMCNILKNKYKECLKNMATEAEFERQNMPDEFLNDNLTSNINYVFEYPNEIIVDNNASTVNSIKIFKFVSKDIIYKCNYENCKFIGKSDDALERHFKTVHRRLLGYSCCHCYYKMYAEISEFDEIKNHLRLHGETLFICNACSYASHIRQNVSVHVREVHKNEFSLTCLKRHFDNANNEEYSVICETYLEDGEITIIMNFCVICLQYLQKNENINDHLNINHQCMVDYQCVHCMILCSDTKTISDHSLKEHKGKNLQIKCSYRFKMFSTTNQQFTNANNVTVPLITSVASMGSSNVGSDKQNTNSSNDNLEWSVSQNSRKFNCNNCTFYCSNIEEFLEHEKSHQPQADVPPSQKTGKSIIFFNPPNIQCKTLPPTKDTKSICSSDLPKKSFENSEPAASQKISESLEDVPFQNPVKIFIMDASKSQKQQPSVQISETDIDETIDRNRISKYSNGTEYGITTQKSLIEVNIENNNNNNSNKIEHSTKKSGIRLVPLENLLKSYIPDGLNNKKTPQLENLSNNNISSKTSNSNDNNLISTQIFYENDLTSLNQASGNIYSNKSNNGVLNSGASTSNAHENTCSGKVQNKKHLTSPNVSNDRSNKIITSANNLERSSTQRQMLKSPITETYTTESFQSRLVSSRLMLPDSNYNLNSFLLYCCNHCEYINNNIKEVITHWEKKHNKERKYPFQFRVQRRLKCGNCTFIGTFRQIKIHHLNEHPYCDFIIHCAENENKCGECDFYSPNLHDSHFKTSHPNLIHQADSNNVFINDDMIEKICSIGFQSLTYRCKFCTDNVHSFLEKARLKSHIEEAHCVVPSQTDYEIEKTEEYFIGCLMCQLFYTRENNCANILRHFRVKHTASYLCNFECEQRFSNFENLLDHYKTYHQDDSNRNFTCLPIENDLSTYLKNLYYLFPNGLIISLYELTKTKYCHAEQFLNTMKEVQMNEIAAEMNQIF